MSQWKRPAEQDIHLNSKRTHVGSVNPGWEYVEPRVYQQPAHQQHEGPTSKVPAAGAWVEVVQHPHNAC
jgi:hypothetical protein